MTSENKILFENCRLCQNKPGVYGLKEDTDLTSQILQCLSINVDDDQSKFLPGSICLKCRTQIQSIYKYTIYIKEVDNKLRQLISNKSSSNKLRFLDNDFDETNNILKCNKCPASFVDSELLEEHMKSHFIQLNYTCPICPKSYNRISNFVIHKKTHLELYCVNCCTVFDSRLNCEAHICTSETDNTESLFIPSKDILPITETQEIKEQDKIEQLYECEICNKCFNRKNNLDAHKNIHKNEFPCKQEKCDKICTSMYKLKIHALRHEGRKPFLCVTCGKGFLTKSSLNCHEKIHLDKKGYECKLCNIQFSVRSNLRTHEKNYHLGLRFYCSQCTKNFVSKNSLERHEKIHSGIREFKCESCESEFYTNKELVKHQKYHKGIRRYQCTECFKTFFEKHHLTIHLRIHTGERPFVCQIPGCDKSFVDNQKLKRHHKARHINL